MAPSATATTTTARPVFSRSLRKPALTASTPDLASVYIAQSRLGLARKASLVALTPTSLASIPDVSESYALDSVLSDSTYAMSPSSPARHAASEDVAVGDAVDVPGGMHGTLRFLGPVQGKKGSFAGVELHPDFAARGKNNGDVDGVSYFATATPGAGIFVPQAKISRRGATINASPMTPTARVPTGARNGNGPKSITPPTPGLSKFSASVGPGARAPSPQIKRPRTSLPRPDSPVRRTHMTPGPRPSLGAPIKVSSRYGSPTNKLAQSVRGDPSKKSSSKLDGKPATGPRSASALGTRHAFDDEPAAPARFQRAQTNGSVGSASSLNVKMHHRSASRADNEEELDRLRTLVAERDLQLKEQGTALAEMSNTITELQAFMDDPDMHRPKSNGFEEKDTAQLRQLLREKNDKIAMLTAEFDAHRADFRSTIDTLELASSETERVYEKRIEEMMAEVRELEARNLDMDSVASQLKGLEELVQELEEGLEDARRGEAEARGEAEFLRGDVERTRSELRREREKAGRNSQGDGANASKELEQKEDEIRGLKAIIHSLSRDSVPGGEGRQHGARPASLVNAGGDPVETKIARDNLERRVAELQALVERKSKREEELELELEALRNGSQQGNAVPRNPHRDSRDTVIPVRTHGSRSPDATHRRGQALDTMPESDTYSSATETSTLWCEICETNGHDILTCTNVFGPDSAKNGGDVKSGRDAALRALAPGDAQPAPLSPSRPKAGGPAAPPPPGHNVKILPNPMEVGPVAGKESGVVDMEQWCAVCEREGHGSLDCPFEDAL
ncbi:hypothetical protein CP533_2249 [Ophiocordyceps camponoti-saundersi (nom. inval.)]|nr:hypothetical protein CP533_2249 [Ophiocordyceps camponoti-saundersi (nom. inval.)]